MKRKTILSGILKGMQARIPMKKDSNEENQHY